MAIRDFHHCNARMVKETAKGMQRKIHRIVLVPEQKLVGEQ
jgi:hypothetical protein